MIEWVEVRRGAYHDSVRLMQATATVQALPGIEDAVVAMATPLNLGLLEGAGFSPDSVAGVGPDDLVVAVRAVDRDTAERAHRTLDEALSSSSRPAEAMSPPPPRTIGRAVADARLALISVPGEHAFVEAMDALRHGAHVMVFSDNVPVSQEAALKEAAADAGVLVMGPDCGTAIVNGIGLGFANVVPPGPVGIVGAAGTGIQQICCLLADAGVGVRHALGTGGRDLSAQVGGASTLAALAVLDEDPDTEVIVVVSKPPALDVAGVVAAAAAACRTPTVVTYLGTPGATLEAAALQALGLLGSTAPEWPAWPVGAGDHRPGSILGLFSGGSLRTEAAAIAATALGSISEVEEGNGHRLVDLGADRYTVGRAHPMIDQSIRIDRLEAAARDVSVGVILLDVVLGRGAHPDPGAELAPVVAHAVGAGAAVVVSLCGTDGDPQGRSRQAAGLCEAGAAVYACNAAATRAAVALVEAVPA